MAAFANDAVIGWGVCCGGRRGLRLLTLTLLPGGIVCFRRHCAGGVILLGKVGLEGGAARGSRRPGGFGVSIIVMSTAHLSVKNRRCSVVLLWGWARSARIGSIG
jgi:hypothetical protein